MIIFLQVSWSTRTPDNLSDQWRPPMTVMVLLYDKGITPILNIGKHGKKYLHDWDPESRKNLHRHVVYIFAMIY